VSLGLQDASDVVDCPADQRRPVLQGLGDTVGVMLLFFCHGISLKLQLSSFEPCFEIATPSNAAITMGPAPRLVTTEPEQEAQRSGYQRGADTMTLDDVVRTHLIFGASNFIVDVAQGVAQRFAARHRAQSGSLKSVSVVVVVSISITSSPI